jgi:tetratricopeptide (TPR) repeat protein
MRGSFAEALRTLGLLIIASYGSAVFGQFPVAIDASDPALAGDSLSSHSGIAPFNYLEATPHDPNDEFGFPSAEPREGKGAISVAELQHPLSGKGRSLILKAQIDLRAGKVEACLQDLDQAMKVAAAVPYVHGVRGAAYLLTGRYPDAISELQLAVQVLPLPANFSNLGYAYLLTGDMEQGEQELRRALELHSSPPQTRYLMGLLLLDRRPQNREACEDLQRAQNLMPAVHMALAVCYVRDGNEDAANGQIREVLGPANASMFEFWKKWVSSVGAQPKPSAAFGLRTQVQSAQK